MSDCEKCDKAEKDIAVLKERLANFEKQYAEDRLQDQKDLSELDGDLDTLLKSQEGRHAIAEFLSNSWKFLLGIACLVWTIMQIIRA